MQFVVVVLVAFLIMAVWQVLAMRKIRANQRMMAGALVNDLDKLAKKAGYSDLAGYYIETKGVEYATIAMTNIRNFVDSFTARGPNS